MDLLTEGEIGPLSNYDDLRVWIGSTLPRDRTISGQQSHTETLIDSLLKYTNLKNEEKKKETTEKKDMDITDTISHEMPTKILDLYTGAAQHFNESVSYRTW